MQKKVLTDFIIDKLTVILLFNINTIFVFLFYYWTKNEKTELIYPMSITIFLLVLYILLDWLKYYHFNYRISNCKSYSNNDLFPKTQEQKRVNKAIKSIYSDHRKKTARIENENRERSAFLAQWAHNLKTPVTVTGLILDKMEDMNMDSSIVESLRNENKRVEDGLQNMLTLMRLDDFSKDYIPTSICLISTIKKVIISKKEQFIYNNVCPVIIAENENIGIITDEKWCSFLIEQIVSNGIKYSAQEGKQKKLYFKIEESDYSVSLKIIDEGVGIPKYDINRIFEPFFTGENGRKFKDSSGIGLYICSLIGKNLGHDIFVKSEVGVGTEVNIAFQTKKE